jgi:hypothetical protein
MLAKKLILLSVGLCSLLLISSFSRFARAQEISPAQEQEFADAKIAIEAAQKARAEKYALEPLKQGQDLLVTAEKARSSQDSVKFTQASRLARAYAELAKAIAELKSEGEKLAATYEELQKAKAEVEQLKKSQ